MNNLKLLNEFVRYHHFKIETLEMVWATVKKNSYFVNIYSLLRKFTLAANVNVRVLLYFKKKITLENKQLLI